MEVIYEKGSQKVPIMSWAVDLEPAAKEQALNGAKLPFAKYVSLMPDAHAGYGVPVGMVLATQGYTIPNAVGVDIGCGMGAYETDVTLDEIMQPHAGQGTILKAVLGDILRDIPTGNGPSGNHSQPQENSSVEDIVDDVYLQGALPTWERVLKAGRHQIGTLGGGNHFIELDVEDETGKVWLLVHSGSRGVGHHVCTYFNKIARTFNDRYFSSVPKIVDLAFLSLDTDEGRQYIDWMCFAQDFAKQNRERMVTKALQILNHVVRGLPHDAPVVMPEGSEIINTHHNYAVFENHHGDNVLVTRKGAVRARTGDATIIPGSMETSSYIATGLGNADSLNSCAHGAGRKMSRRKAFEARTAEHMVASLGKLGIELATHDVSEVVDEGGHAYKDINEVIAASADLVRPTHRLRPIGVVKGGQLERRGRNKGGRSVAQRYNLTDNEALDLNPDSVE